MITAKEEFVPEYFPNNCSVSMHREVILSEDGVDLGRMRVHSMAFMPGDIKLLKAHIGDDKSPIVAFCEAAWTPDVVAARVANDLANSAAL